MARMLVCDACGAQAPETGDEKNEWTAITLAKIVTPTAPFQREDLCPRCTSVLRSFLQVGAPPEERVDG